MHLRSPRIPYTFVNAQETIDNICQYDAIKIRKYENKGWGVELIKPARNLLIPYGGVEVTLERVRQIQLHSPSERKDYIISFGANSELNWDAHPRLCQDLPIGCFPGSLVNEVTRDANEELSARDGKDVYNAIFVCLDMDRYADAPTWPHIPRSRYMAFVEIVCPYYSPRHCPVEVCVHYNRDEPWYNPSVAAKGYETAPCTERYQGRGFMSSRSGVLDVAICNAQLAADQAHKAQERETYAASRVERCGGLPRPSPPVNRGRRYNMKGGRRRYKRISSDIRCSPRLASR